MTPITIAQEIIDGRRLTRADDLSYFLTCNLTELCVEQTASVRRGLEKR